jgi:hypothetical protein
MSTEAWIWLFILGIMFVGWLILWRTQSDDLAAIQHRERAFEAMRKWSE